MTTDSPTTSTASEPVKITYSGLTYILGGKAPEGLRAPVAICEACDAVMPMTNDAMYEHAEKRRLAGACDG
jgi:hypothetical protein